MSTVYSQKTLKPTRKVGAAAVVAAFGPVIGWVCVSKLGMTAEVATGMVGGLVALAAYMTRSRVGD